MAALPATPGFQPRVASGRSLRLRLATPARRRPPSLSLRGVDGAVKTPVGCHVAGAAEATYDRLLPRPA